MGGHALKGIPLSRKSAQHYTYIKETILARLASCGLVAQTPRETPGKDSYGDLDILYVADGRDMREFVVACFQPDEICHNGPYISFNTSVAGAQHSDFQIDLIRCTRDNFEMSAFYFSYGDFGGIMGRIANAYGLKFGSEGLWICFDSLNPHEVNVKVSPDKLELTKSPQTICEFFGGDYEKWLEGFQSINAIFEWITSLSVFNPMIFTVLNYKHRQRVADRPMYKAFLCDYLKIKTDNIEPASEHIGEILESQRLKAIKYFQAETKLIGLQRQRTVIIDRNKRFNAQLFMSHGLAGKELGESIVKFKQHIETSTEASFISWVDSASDDDIVQTVNSFVHM